jgi:dATP pyrophosphohydrolase
MVSDEHSDLVWLPYGEAHDRLRYDSNKTALWELSERLRRHDLLSA